MRSSLASRSFPRPETWCHGVKWTRPRSCPRRWTMEDMGSPTQVWRCSIASSCTEHSGRKNVETPGLPEIAEKAHGAGGLRLGPRPAAEPCECGPELGLAGGPRCGCLGALTLHKGAEKLENEPGSGGKKCLLQLLSRPLGPREKIWAKGPPWKPLFGTMFSPSLCYQGCFVPDSYPSPKIIVHLHEKTE